MKAIVLEGFGDVDHFHLAEIENPVPKAEEVLIRIEAAAFNPIDYQMRQGRREKQLMTSSILGREMSGVIVAVGSQVAGFLPGDEVMAASGSKGSNGSYAEYMAINPIMIAHKPSNISFEEAAAIPSAGLTAWQCFKRMNIQAEQRVFITEAYIDSDEGAEMAWLLEVDPEGITAWVIFNELFDVFVVCDKIDELHEQIQEVFPEAPIPDFPYGQFPTTPDYFIWLDKLLKGTPPGYQLISFGDSYGDNLQGLIISRADTERIMDLCKQLNIKASKSMLD